MSSHLEYATKMMEQHDKNCCFAPENGQSLIFTVGEIVIYTNDYNIQFYTTIIDLYKRPSKPCTLYAAGARYLIGGGRNTAWWFPHKEKELTKIENQEQAFKDYIYPHIKKQIEEYTVTEYSKYAINVDNLAEKANIYFTYFCKVPLSEKIKNAFIQHANAVQVYNLV